MNPIDPINAIDATNEVDDKIKYKFDGINKVLIELMNLVSRMMTEDGRLRSLKGLLWVEVCKANAG